MRKTLFAAALAGLVLVACNSGGDWAGDPEKVNDIQSGMTQDEVKRILGPATQVIDEDMGNDMRLTAWEYRGPNDRLNISFDPQTGLVMGTARNGKEIVRIPD